MNNCVNDFDQQHFIQVYTDDQISFVRLDMCRQHVAVGPSDALDKQEINAKRKAATFFQLFKKGAVASKPVRWTVENVDKLTGKLGLSVEWVRTMSEFVIEDTHGIFHPTQKLLDTIT